MPIYEYRRDDGTTFEVLQKFTDEPLTEDPDTGKPVERVFRAPAIHFKGSGFYNTDYGKRKRGGGSTDKDDAKSSSSDSSSSDSTSSDSGRGSSGDSKGASDKKTSSASSSD